MILKKEAILNTALQLFSEHNYANVSTKTIAQEAKVSEGLIFKHFTNKKGLLDAVFQLCSSKISAEYNSILSEENAASVLKKIIEIPYEILDQDYVYWQLFYKLKWEKEYQDTEKMIPIIEKLTQACENLGIKDAEKEAEFLIMVLESITEQILIYGKPSQLKYKYFLIHKYTL